MKRCLVSKIIVKVLPYSFGLMRTKRALSFACKKQLHGHPLVHGSLEVVGSKRYGIASLQGDSRVINSEVTGSIYRVSDLSFALTSLALFLLMPRRDTDPLSTLSGNSE